MVRLAENIFFDNMSTLYASKSAVAITAASAVRLEDNKFHNNMAGRGASAVSLYSVHCLNATGNEFTNNGPAYSVMEPLYSPY